MPLRTPQQPPAIAEKIRRILRPALHQVSPERVVILGRDRRDPAQRRVLLVVARQRRKRDTGLPEPRGELLQAIGPIALAAQYPRHDQVCLRRGLVEIKVHRHRMGQMH